MKSAIARIYLRRILHDTAAYKAKCSRMSSSQARRAREQERRCHSPQRPATIPNAGNGTSGHAENRNGYELMTELADATDGILDIKEGTVYPMLHRLEDAGYVSSRWEAAGRSVPRKYYALESSGSDRLSALIAEWQRLVTGLSKLLGDEGS